MVNIRGIAAFAVTLSLLLSSFQITAPAPAAERFERPYPPSPEAAPAAAQLYQEQPFSLQPDKLEQISGVESYTRVVYQVVGIANNEYNWEIARVPYLSDHHTPENVSNHPAYDITPRLSPDGATIAFSSDRDGRYEIYTMKWDGSQQTRLTFGDGEQQNLSPVWTPDGARIAFYTNRDGNDEIYVMNADGSAQTRLTYHDASDFSPTWSPDGQRIAWIRVVSSFEGVIVIADADGSDAAVISPPLAYLDNLAWYPEGDWLAFNHDANADAWFDIGSIHSDGSGLRTTYWGSSYTDLWMGSWVADGSVLILRVSYDGEFEIHEISMRRGWISGGDWLKYYDNFPNPFSPHAQRTDNAAPVSAVDELPAYSRASGFLVSWSGQDVGPAGVDDFRKQLRQGPTGEWIDWGVGLPGYVKSAEYYSAPGEHVYFRSAAVDYAGNVEAWPEGDGDTDTMLYLWQLAGQIGDNRNHPVPLASLSLSPPAANSLQGDPQGAYTAYLIEGGEHSLQAEVAGYGALPGMKVAVNGDDRLDASLPPSTNLVTNGGFENSADPFAGWTISGTLPFTSTQGHSGERALRLGELCAPPCLSAPEQPYAALLHSAPNLDYGPDGTLHVVWNRTEFASRAPDGEWSYEVIPGRFGTIGSSDSYESRIQVDPMGNVHVIVMGGTNAYYMQKPAGGDWLPPYELEDAGSLEFAVDSTGKVHIAYWCFSGCAYASGTYYLSRTPAGVWREPLSLEYGGTPPLLGVGPDGTVHLMYQELILSALPANLAGWYADWRRIFR